MARNILTPRIVYAEGREQPRIWPTRLKIYADATTPEYAKGSWIVYTENGFVPVASAGAGADFVIDSIETAAGVRLPFQYVATGSTTQYYVWAYPIGGLVFDMQEDADTTPITDANSGQLVPMYADPILTAFADTSTADRLTGSMTPNIKIDSSSANSSSSGLLLQLLGLSPIADNAIYSATSLASPRTFRVKIISTIPGYNQ